MNVLKSFRGGATKLRELESKEARGSEPKPQVAQQGAPEVGLKRQEDGQRFSLLGADQPRNEERQAGVEANRDMLVRNARTIPAAAAVDAAAAVAHAPPVTGDRVVLDPDEARHVENCRKFDLHVVAIQGGEDGEKAICASSELINELKYYADPAWADQPGNIRYRIPLDRVQVDRQPGE